MATNAPGMHFRKGMSLIQLFHMFPDDEGSREVVYSHTLAGWYGVSTLWECQCQ